MAIEGDSTEYELLIQWCEKLPFFEEPKSLDEQIILAKGRYYCTVS